MIEQENRWWLELLSDAVREAMGLPPVDTQSEPGAGVTQVYRAGLSLDRGEGE